MTELMKGLRRSPRTLLEHSGAPGAGPGSVTLVLARAGTGKTALLTGIGLDAILAGQPVLHVSLEANVEKVRDWYDDLLEELLRLEGRTNVDHAALHHSVDEQRHIQSFLDGPFTAARLDATLDRLARRMDFRPRVVVIDRIDLDAFPREEMERLKKLAGEREVEIWTSSRLFRSSPETREGHLPSPAESVEDVVDIVLSMRHEGQRVRLNVLKDHDEITSRDLDVLLDPTTLLLVPEAEVGGRT